MRLLAEVFSAFPVGKSSPSQLGPVTNLSLHCTILQQQYTQSGLAMVRVRKVPGLERLALAAYRQLVVDLSGKVEEAVRGKQMGLGMEQEVG